MTKYSITNTDKVIPKTFIKLLNSLSAPTLKSIIENKPITMKTIAILEHIFNTKIEYKEIE